MSVRAPRWAAGSLRFGSARRKARRAAGEVFDGDGDGERSRESSREREREQVRSRESSRDRDEASRGESPAGAADEPRDAALHDPTLEPLPDNNWASQTEDYSAIAAPVGLEMEGTLSSASHAAVRLPVTPDAISDLEAVLAPALRGVRPGLQVPPLAGIELVAPPPAAEAARRKREIEENKAQRIAHDIVASIVMQELQRRAVTVPIDHADQVKIEGKRGWES